MSDPQTLCPLETCPLVSVVVQESTNHVAAFCRESRYSRAAVRREIRYLIGRKHIRYRLRVYVYIPPGVFRTGPLQTPPHAPCVPCPLCTTCTSCVPYTLCTSCVSYPLCTPCVPYPLCTTCVSYTLYTTCVPYTPCMSCVPCTPAEVQLEGTGAVPVSGVAVLYLLGFCYNSVILAAITNLFC